MSNTATLTITGLDDQRQQFQQLPQTMTRKSQGPIASTAASAAADIRAGYPKRTGGLAAGVRVVSDGSGLRASATVVNDDPVAGWFENGTQARHTALGANRGSMPPGHVFIPRMIRWRKVKDQRIRQVMEGEGLSVRDV